MADGFDSARLAEDLRRTLEPLDRARTLPGACYADAAIHALEEQALFACRWLAVARIDDVPDAGSFVTREVAGERVLVVRDEGGTLRAFFNVCRHRGSRLVDESSGRLRSAIACPYHAWSYAFDGALRQAPRMDTTGRAHELSLVTVPLATRDGFVFVNLASAAPALDEALADLPDWSRFDLASLRKVRALEYRVAANWKLVCENYSECYHCPRAHPQLDRLCELSAGGFEAGRCYNGGPMGLRAGFDTLSTSGRSAWPRLDTAARESDAALVHYYLVYPNLMLGVHPDYLTVHTVWPVAAGASRVVCEIHVPERTLGVPGFDPAEVIEFWELTNTQDWALCERVQRGVASRGFRPGPYAPSERCVHAFDCWYAEWLLQAGTRHSPLPPG